MDPGSMPIERLGSITPQGQGRGPLAMAEQQQQAAAADTHTHTQAPAHSGAPIRKFFSLQAAQEHVRQQETIITEQARNIGILSTRIDTMSIQLTQLLRLVRHRDMASVGESGDRSEDQNATSAPGVSGSKPILILPPILIPPLEPTSTAANVRQSKAEVLSVGGNTHAYPARQARRGFLSRDRTSASPPALETGGIPRVALTRSWDLFRHLFSQKARVPQEDSDNRSITATRPRPQSVNVEIAELLWKFYNDRAYTFFTNQFSSDVSLLVYLFIHYLVSCHCHSIRINCFARFDGIRSHL
jgi:hypothetical protein